jgi:hypothetical protein
MMVCTYVHCYVLPPCTPPCTNTYTCCKKQPSISSSLPEDPAERRGGPVVSGVVPAKVGCARHRDKAQAPAPQVLLAHLFILRTLCIHMYFHAIITNKYSKLAHHTKWNIKDHFVSFCHYLMVEMILAFLPKCNVQCMYVHIHDWKNDFEGKQSVFMIYIYLLLRLACSLLLYCSSIVIMV